MGYVEPPQIWQVLGVGQDITRFHKAQKELRQVTAMVQGLG